jgi:hypothetical protein
MNESVVQVSDKAIYTFQLPHIIPALEDGYADHYKQDKVGAKPLAAQ